MAAFDKEALARLEALGRRRGHLTTGDLEGELPIGQMTPDDLALVIVHLEEAGIPVEVDPALLGGEARPTAPPDPGFVLPQPAAGPFPVVDVATPMGTAPLPPGAQPAPPARTPGVHWAVAVAGALVLAILLAALFFANRS